MNNFVVLKKDLTNDDLGCIIKTQQNERGNKNEKN